MSSRSLVFTISTYISAKTSGKSVGGGGRLLRDVHTVTHHVELVANCQTPNNLHTHHVPPNIGQRMRSQPTCHGQDHHYWTPWALVMRKVQVQLCNMLHVLKLSIH